jgi:hypothetical protein
MTYSFVGEHKINLRITVVDFYLLFFTTGMGNELCILYKS